MALPLISIVIVNYNVKDFLSECLKSISRSNYLNYGGKIEVIVVDNASTDGSNEYFPLHFPNVNYLYQNVNLGFGKANNIGIEEANGEYILLLNPDTVLNIDTLTTMVKNIEGKPDIWAAGCRVLNTDGTFQLACRRGFPTIWNSFCKLFGLQDMFPKVKLFSGYNKLYLSDKDEYDIEAIIGAFMFFRADRLKELGGFDKDFFMYGEDIDLCKRVWDSGGRVRYFPNTEITHHKGESTKRTDINHLAHFYEAMEIYAKKHTSNSLISLLLLKAAIKARGLFAFISQYKRDISIFLFDAALLSIAAMASTWFVKGEPFNFPSWAYPDVYIALILTHFASFFFVGVYLEKPLSIARSIPGLLLEFLLLSSLTYYFKEYAFSRGVLLLTIISGGGVILLSKILLSNINSARNKGRRILIPETYTDDSLLNLLAKRKKFILHTYDEGNYNLESDIPLELDLPYSQRRDSFIASTIFDGEIGPRYSLFNIKLPRYRFIKRFMDIVGATLGLTLLLPATIFTGNTKLMWRILSGKMSLVGVIPTEKHKFAFSKLGLTDTEKAYRLGRLSEKDIELLNEKYLRDYSPLTDLELLLATAFKRKNRI